MGQIGTHFSSAAEAIGVSALFSAFTTLMGYINYENYLNNKIDYSAIASMTAGVAITGLAFNNAYYYLFDGGSEA